MYLYLKALHIIFIVTWFAGLFYMPRLLIYNTEAGEQPSPAKEILRRQFSIMLKRLWFGIAWPSAIITLVMGLWVMFDGPWASTFKVHTWLHIKLLFVLLLYVYHHTLHFILKQQLRGEFKYTSQQLRIWNEMATIFLVAIVMLVTVKQNMSAIWGVLGLVGFVVLLMSAIKIYKIIRQKKSS